MCNFVDSQANSKAIAIIGIAQLAHQVKSTKKEFFMLPSVFNFGQNTVDVKLDNKNIIWFRASHIADVLEYSNISDMLDLTEERRLSSVLCYDSIGRKRKTTYISEAGLYEILIRSNKEKSKQFKNWVIDEVLPSIRKNGSYSLQSDGTIENELFINNYDLLKHIQSSLGFDDNQILLISDKSVKKQLGISVLDKLDIKLISEKQEQVLTPTDIALELSAKTGNKVTNREVNLMLVKYGYQVKLENKTYAPTDKGKSFAVILDTNKKHSDGTIVKQIKWYASVVDILLKLD